MGELYKKKTEKVFTVNLLKASKEDLERISEDRVLGLSVDEMEKIQARFKAENRNPTDVELEAFAQSWSEHCCYKTSKPILKESVFSIKAPQSICVISEDAGVVDFDEEHAYAVKMESHNHPSALDPYGGAATGIGGVLRDVVCMGAQPVALIDPLFFGPLDYPDEEVPSGTKHPRYLFHGVVDGIQAYGNRVGIPTVSGMLFFDESYLTNCIVNVGCIGIVKKENITHSRVGASGDYYILAGGNTGRDGIHGVTFASAELSEESDESDRPAVQLGYAIMKEPLIHACLEVIEKKLITGLKDFGGGGLSCVSSEMAHAAGLGAVVELDKIPLKEPGLSPWEIWVSESQERMMLSVAEENLGKVLEVFDFWDVPATVVGRVEEGGRIRATYNGVEVLNLDLEFLTEGVCYERPVEIIERDESDPDFKMPDLAEAAANVLGMPNVGSCEAVIRRYDHEVRGATVIKPMQGVINHQTHGDAAVIKPLTNSNRGLALTANVNSAFVRHNPYLGAASAVEETMRNLVAVGARPHSLVDCLNFGNPEKPDRLGDFKRACEGLHLVADYFKIPYVSGNVSFYNEGVTGPIAPTPTILGVGIANDVRKCITSDLKEEGNIVYLVGETEKELGASQYLQMLGLSGGRVPRVDPKSFKEKMDALLSAMDKGLVRSCHDLSEGGFLVAAAEMCFGGDLGMELDVSDTYDLRTDVKLFSESNGRWLVEVAEANTAEFEKTVKATQIGRVTKENKIKIKDGEVEVDLPLDELYDKWRDAVEKEE